MKKIWITKILSIFFLTIFFPNTVYAKIVKLSECYLIDAKPKKKYVSLDKFDDYNKEKDDWIIDTDRSKISHIIKYNSVIRLGVRFDISQSKKESIISIIDADGEDAPNELKKMIKFAIKYPKNIIVSNRTKRSEVFIFKVLYKIHLIITLLLTNKWISFGNFSSFNSRNLKNLLKNNYIWFSYSSAVVKNCLIKNLYAARKKRYFGNSKVSFFKLFLHSLKILSVFQLKIILNTIFIVFLLSIISLFYDLFFIKLVTYFLLIINFLVLIIRMSFLFEKEKYKINQINNIKIIK